MAPPKNPPKTRPVEPLPVISWEPARRNSLAKGGYGTISEQLEILGEQGVDAFRAHVAAVKAAHPKPS